MPTREPLSTGSRGGRFSAFAIAWALSTLVTSASFQEPRFAIVDAALAALLLIWPNSLPLFLGLCTFVAGRILWRLPEGPNHYILELLACLGFLAIGLALWRRRSLDAQGFIERAAPVGRILMLVVYFFAVLDKTNWDYLSPHGCGWELIGPFFGGDAFAAQHPLAWQLATYGSLLMEAFLLVGLATPRLRRSALIAGVCFHSLLAVVPYEGIASFSSLTLALYVLFMPEATDWSEWSFLPRLTNWKTRAIAILGAGGAYGGLGFLAAGWIAHRTYPNLQDYGAISSEANLANVVWSAIVFVPMGIWLAGSLFRSMPGPLESRVPLRLRPARALWVLPILAFFNGLCPFLGLKTQTSFAMFSNLRTEQGRFNHVFLPASMQVFDYQKEVIQVTSAPRSFTTSSSGVNLVPIEFRRRFARLATGEIVIFKRNGKGYALTKGLGGEYNVDLAEPLSFWQSKLLRFRPVVDGPQPCRH